MALLPLGTAEQFKAQRVLLHSINPYTYQRVSLRKLMFGFESSPTQRPPLDPLPNAAYGELNAITGLALERGIWPPLRLWNEEHNFPYAYRTAQPDKLTIVGDLAALPMPSSKRQPLRRDIIADRCFASMFDIVDYHVRAWDKRVYQGKPSTIEGALDINTEVRMRSRFQEVSQKTFNRGEPIKRKEIQQLNPFILKNAEVGLMIVWSLVDLIPYLYQLHFNTHPTEEEHIRLVDSAVDDVCIDLAGIAMNVILGIEKRSLPTHVGPRVSVFLRPSGAELERLHFDPKDFRLYETSEGLKIHFSPEHLTRMSQEIPESIERTFETKNLIHTGCPASIAKADGQQSIIRYILDWMKIWMKR